MKSFVILCVVLVAGVHAANVILTPAQKARAHEIECIKESGVSTEVLVKTQKGHIPEDEDGLKKFVICLFNKEGIDNLNIEEAVVKLPPGVDKGDAKKVSRVRNVPTRPFHLPFDF